MQVRATQEGYGGIPRHQLRQPGDIFEVRDGQKDTWYEPVKTEPKNAKSKAVKDDDGDALA